MLTSLAVPSNMTWTCGIRRSFRPSATTNASPSVIVEPAIPVDSHAPGTSATKEITSPAEVQSMTCASGPRKPPIPVPVPVPIPVPIPVPTPKPAGKALFYATVEKALEAYARKRHMPRKDIVTLLHEHLMKVYPS